MLANSEDPIKLSALLRAPGVTAGIGPNPMLPTTAAINGYTVPLEVVGRETLSTAVDHPVITAGTPTLTGASIVLEQARRPLCRPASATPAMVRSGAWSTLATAPANGPQATAITLCFEQPNTPGQGAETVDAGAAKPLIRRCAIAGGVGGYSRRGGRSAASQRASRSGCAGLKTIRPL